MYLSTIESTVLGAARKVNGTCETSYRCPSDFMISNSTMVYGSTDTQAFIIHETKGNIVYSIHLDVMYYPRYYLFINVNIITAC